MFSIGSRTVKWTFTIRPLSRYKLPRRDQDIPIERRLSATTASLDVFEILSNQVGSSGRGLGTHFPSPREHPASFDYPSFRQGTLKIDGV